MSARCHGVAYGLEFRGEALGTGLTPVSGPSLPSVTIGHEPEPRRGEFFLDGERAQLVLSDGLRTIAMSRADATAVYCGPELAPDELVHPYLGPVAAVFSRWHGREVFHAGAVVVDGGAWALLGPMQAGKSTLLAALAARGLDVLSDDLVIADGDRAFAGPRSIDLRSRLPAELAGELELGTARGGSRLRAKLGAIAPSVPLRGWVFLGWGVELELSPISAAECLNRLAGWRAWPGLGSDPVQMLTLAGLPAFTLSRSREWSALPGTLDMLCDTLASASSPEPQ